MQGIEIEIVAKPEFELIVVLHALEVEGLPVHAHQMRLARGNQQIRSAGGDLNPAGFHPGNKHDHLQGARLDAALEMRLAKSRGEIGAGGSGGTVCWNERMHGRKKFVVGLVTGGSPVE